MWNWYAEEKQHEYRNEELERAARRRIGIAAVRAQPRRAFADRLGRALVRLGTRLQAWAQPQPMDAHLAGAEE